MQVNIVEPQAQDEQSSSSSVWGEVCLLFSCARVSIHLVCCWVFCSSSLLPIFEKITYVVSIILFHFVIINQPNMCYVIAYLL
jgi:hypothetical protein